MFKRFFPFEQRRRRYGLIHKQHVFCARALQYNAPSHAHSIAKGRDLMQADLKITRDAHGIPHVQAASYADMYWAQGYLHARDRGMQTLMMRILGQGRVCELLNDSEESLAIDTFFRRMNWYGNLDAELEKLSADEKAILRAYAEGINAGLREKKPWVFKLLGYQPEPWQPGDSILIARMIGYLTLAQSQEEIERLFVEMVQAGLSREKLEALFPGNLDEADFDLLRAVRLEARIVTPASLWNSGAPRMMASNNWVISGARTASGNAILANDPHLETNRLPAVWSEMVLSCCGRYVMGATMPGTPGILVGRSPEVAWGVTYAFIDAVDSWVEDCRDGKYRKGDQWLAFKTRTETIKRKKSADVTLTFYENDHGVLAGDPYQPGYYLATRWAAADSGARTLRAILQLAESRTVRQAMEAIGGLETGWNFVLADREGNIGYQMTGKVPRRRRGASGFVPLPGWDPANDWQGFLSVDELPRAYNPPEGFFATANQDLNAYGKANPINMPMGSYRAERINDLLAANNAITLEAIYAMHADVYSLQAERFMDILRPILATLMAEGRICQHKAEVLHQWDLRYSPDSQGAYLFEQFYHKLYREVFGRHGMGIAALDFLFNETGTFIDFYQNFDRVLLAEESPWFEGQSREALWQQAAIRAFEAADCSPTGQLKTWGEANQFVMQHLILGGLLPRFLGFDRGPFACPGGRATINQGQIYRSAGRVTSFMPTLRLVTDLGSDTIHTNLAGGPSDDRFSKWYVSDLENWLHYRYKAIHGRPKR